MAENTVPAAPKKEQPKKPGAFARFGKFIRDTKSESKKISWPTKSQILNNTLVVCVMITIIGLFIALFDAIFSYGLGLLVGLG